MQKKILVIKLGTAVITDNEGKVNRAVIKKISEEIAALTKEYNVVLVSSGAVGSGKSFIKNYKGTLNERKAAAAVGNPVLIQLYHTHFYKHGITIAQALCERHHFSNRTQFLQLKETFDEFWKNDIIPVVNENDLVSNIELKFSDNDELATLIAVGLFADTLIICTSVGGLRDFERNIIPFVPQVDDTILKFVTTEKSSTGLGGMVSKLTFTKLATSLGIRVIITGIGKDASFEAALKGKCGSTFAAKKSTLKARQKWLASGSITLGSIRIDEGAAKALKQRKSLLTVGVLSVDGDFSEQEAVQVIDNTGTIIAVAKSKLSASDLKNSVKQKNIIAAHADDIVILN
ncbi:MAG: glutamate 5-kinase [Chitinophagaceae bacterium]